MADENLTPNGAGDSSDNVIAGFSIFICLIGFIMYFVKKDAVGLLKTSIKQGAVLFCFFVAAWIVMMIFGALSLIPYLGIIFIILNVIIYIAMAVIGIMGLVAAIMAWTGKEWKVPIIANIGEAIFK